MPALRYKLNFRNTIFRDDPMGETVGIYLKSGHTRNVVWRGFIDINAAIGKPVQVRSPLIPDQLLTRLGRYPVE